MEENKGQRDFLEDCEAISSSRETEYSVSNLHNQSQCLTSGYTTVRTLGCMSSPFSPNEFIQNKYSPDQESQSIKSRLRRNIRKHQQNLTMTLKEANQKAESQR